MEEKLSEKIAWVTGSGRGLGRAIAIALAKEEARVVVSARTTTEIEEVARQINANGGRAMAIRCDVQNQHEIAQLVNQVEKSWGAVDILINNAGIAFFKKILDTDPAEWDQTMNINLRGVFLCCQAVLPAMISRKSGQIINVVSVAGRQPYYNCGAYCASKYGLMGFTDVLRMETRKYGIRVTALLPGATDTAIWGKANVDRNRMMQTDQVAEAVVALCKSDPSVTIEELVVRPILGDLP